MRRSRVQVPSSPPLQPPTRAPVPSPRRVHGRRSPEGRARLLPEVAASTGPRGPRTLPRLVTGAHTARRGAEEGLGHERPALLPGPARGLRTRHGLRPTPPDLPPASPTQIDPVGRQGREQTPGLPPLAAPLLRHGLYRRTGDVQLVKRALTHRSISSTRFYAAPSDARVLSAIG